MIKVAIGIIGIGYQGFRGFISLLAIEEILRNDGIKIGGIIIIEPDSDARKDCERISKVLYFPVKLFSSLDEFFYFIERKKDNFLKKFNCIIFYDASPTKWHSKNLNQIIYYNLYYNLNIPTYYFGEKPISTDKFQLYAWLKEEKLKFYCNFTELQNSAYLTLKSYLDETNFQINSFKFWRASSIGFQKLIDPIQRTGITGGALEDKGIHDVALTIDLLGGVKKLKLKLKKQENKKDPESVMVVSPKIEPIEIHFMPANLYSLFSPKPLFMDNTGEKVIDEIFKIEETSTKEYKKYWYFAADSEFKMKIIWSLQDERQIEAKYYFSWAGLSEEIKKEIEKEIIIKFPTHLDWLGEKEESVPQHVPIIGGIRYPFTETRLMIVEGVNKKDNREEKIICNLLRKSNLGIRNLWIYKLVQGKNKAELNIKENEFQFSQNFLARMFYNVILSVVEDVKKNKEKEKSERENFYEKIGKDITCWAHLIIAEARERAFKKKLKVNQLKEIESVPSKKSLVKEVSKESMERYKKTFLI